MIICFLVCFQTTYFCWGRSMETGAWGREHGDWSNFLGMIYFQKNIFHRRIQNAFFHIGMEAWARVVIISFAVCFWTTYFCRAGSWGWERVNGSVRIGFCLRRSYDSNKMFHIDIIESVTGGIICFIVCFQATYFCCGRSVGTGE